MKKGVSLHVLLEKGCFAAVFASLSVQSSVNSDKNHLRMLKNTVYSDKNELNMPINGHKNLNFKLCLAHFVFLRFSTKKS